MRSLKVASCRYSVIGNRRFEAWQVVGRLPPYARRSWIPVIVGTNSTRSLTSEILTKQITDWDST
jgi:hypothetical protein